ncbi:MAG: peroxiredoxin [Candidatus Kapaibacteriota bacterium]
MSEQTKPLMIGDQFPEVELQTTHGKMKLPKAFEGKWFILFSHPADFTPVCTTEFVAFQKRYEEFKKLNCELIGLSMDQVFAHIQWVSWIKDKLNVQIDFPIIADNGDFANTLGIVHPKSGNNTIRAVYFVDPTAKIRAILFYPQELGRNLDEFLRMLKAFQVGAENGAAMPANWPNNELIGDKVIVPPPTDWKAAEYKKSKYDHYDWWFMYKEIGKE